MDRIIGKDRNEIKEKPSTTGIPGFVFLSHRFVEELFLTGINAINAEGNNVILSNNIILQKQNINL